MMHIRKAGKGDCLLIRELASRTWWHTYGAILSAAQLDYMFEMMYSPESLRRQIEEQGHVYFVACRDDVPCGYVSVQPQGERLYHLQKIYVLPGMQGTGAGRLLMEHALQYVKGLYPSEPVTVELNVNRENKAKTFYEHMGFHVARSGDFPIGNGFYMNDYIMVIEL